ncbi:hypothetical protein A2Z22_03190 [Candidatus Woesebacteria bacterium RBG_16_34_12]|uniref:Uncharacterized protein n=1 Tax=Candidatus Woesebacteria bacterium RBG_16_34_12 TaxID=1802480 RepID=A0A1F7XAT3_9BACT|nr:MAG: hypothetical protein A2Z22_03190 [Candidatus Woesebacteria bacterium RBG_16_34_12]
MSHNRVTKIIQYFIFIITGVFLEFWIFTYSQLLSIRDILFNQSIIWGHFAALMIIGNLSLIALYYMVNKLTERLLKLKTNLSLTTALIWAASFVVIILYYYS